MRKGIGPTFPIESSTQAQISGKCHFTPGDQSRFPCIRRFKCCWRCAVRVQLIMVLKATSLFLSLFVLASALRCRLSTEDRTCQEDFEAEAAENDRKSTRLNSSH